MKVCDILYRHSFHNLRACFTTAMTTPLCFTLVFCQSHSRKWSLRTAFEFFAHALPRSTELYLRSPSDPWHVDSA